MRLDANARRVRALLGTELPAPGVLDADALGAVLGVSSATIRRAVRDLRDAAGLAALRSAR